MRNLGLGLLVVFAVGATLAAEVLRFRRVRRDDGWAGLTDRL